VNFEEYQTEAATIDRPATPSSEMDPHILADFKALLAATPRWKPPETVLVLQNSRPRTIAEAFEENSGVRHKYNSKDGWSIFSNDKYQKVEDPDEIEVYLRRFLGEIMVEKVTKEGPKQTHYESSPSKIKNLMGEIRSLEDVHLMPGQNAPQSITGQLDPNKVIALNNGLLDWSVYPYKLHSHTPDFYTFNYLPFKWEGEQHSDMWIQFLHDTVNSDVEKFELLQMYIGYCLLLHYTGKGYFLLIKGEADTGKSVFVDTITHLFGNGNVSAVSLEDFNDKHMMYDAYGKYVNVSDESPESFSDKAVENTLKKYTGGTQFHFKAMYRAAFSAYPTAKLIMATNNRPAFSDTSEGVWTRLRYLEFNKVVAAKDQDRQLTQKLIATEMPGILKWAVDGARKFIANGYKLPIPESSREAMDEYRRESCPELGFMEDNFKECDAENTDLSITCDMFRNCYEQWCKKEGIGARKMKTIKITMGKTFPKHCRKQRQRNGELKYYYCGIQLKRESEFYVDTF